MGNHIAVTDNGKHQIGRKLFITDENKKHRKVKKAFLTIGGVHRQVFAAGHDWAKYSCDIIPAYYEEISTSGSVDSAWHGTTFTLYDDYGFSKSYGFEGYNGSNYSPGSSAVVGKYKVTDTLVVKISTYTEQSSARRYTGTKVAACKQVDEAYTKGTTSYGTIFTDEGELPEAGTLISGSVAEGYCVLQINGAYYYYEIVG